MLFGAHLCVGMSSLHSDPFLTIAFVMFIV